MSTHLNLRLGKAAACLVAACSVGGASCSASSELEFDSLSELSGWMSAREVDANKTPHNAVELSPVRVKTVCSVGLRAETQSRHCVNNPNRTKAAKDDHSHA